MVKKIRRHTDTSGVGAETRGRQEKIVFLKSLGYRLRKVSGEALYWLYSDKKPTTLNYTQLDDLYDREKATASEGYTRLLISRKSVLNGGKK